MEPTKTKQEKALPALVKQFHLKNIMAAPRLTKVTVNSGAGSRREKGRIELISDRLSKITGQKASPRSAKQSIATFKLRQGDVIGVSTTLRGERMFGFLDKVLNVALPRMRDFRGLSVKGIDDMGNYSMGIKEHSIFPESSDEDLRDIFGFSITVGTTAKSKAQAEALLRALGLPFKKVEEAKEAKKKDKVVKKKK
ncbi:MAG: 50S ribosomal protein L5 [Parcubacteria group bacterium RIFOXYD2_FULL_52_8]|nr:ribosomal protein L5 [uncultured bacterium]OHB25018.1 MAG: 50S ribosomal protein L5 [Parcubacteria group bacterium RIFOXYD2_FULL_52_8]